MDYGFVIMNYGFVIMNYGFVLVDYGFVTIGSGFLAKKNFEILRTLNVQIGLNTLNLLLARSLIHITSP